MYITKRKIARSEHKQSAKYCQYTGAITYDRNVIIGFGLTKYHIYTQLFRCIDQSW